MSEDLREEGSKREAGMVVPDRVVLHPLVLLSVVDHYNRVARDARKRVVGVLLGDVRKGVVDITNSFAGELGGDCLGGHGNVTGMRWGEFVWLECWVKDLVELLLPRDRVTRCTPKNFKDVRFGQICNADL